MSRVARDVTDMVYRHSFRGKVWKIEPWAKGLRCCAKCDSPYDKNKTIRISKNMEGVERIEAIVHEGVHACFWDIDEDAVDEAAKSIATLLWRMGYRCGDEVMDGLMKKCKERGVEFSKNKRRGK